MGSSRTVTAGSGGVTVNLLAAKDASNPTLYVLPGSGGCGSGVAGYSANCHQRIRTLHRSRNGSYHGGGWDDHGGPHSDGGKFHSRKGGRHGPDSARTSVPNGTCIIGVALASATVGNTVLVAYDGTGVYGAGAASSVAWNAITSPTGNQSLSMGSNTTTWTFGATTGGLVNLVTITDTASNRDRLSHAPDNGQRQRGGPMGSGRLQPNGM